MNRNFQINKKNFNHSSPFKFKHRNRLMQHPSEIYFKNVRISWGVHWLRATCSLWRSYSLLSYWLCLWHFFKFFSIFCSLHLSISWDDYNEPLSPRHIHLLLPTYLPILLLICTVQGLHRILYFLILITNFLLHTFHDWRYACTINTIILSVF